MNTARSVVKWTLGCCKYVVLPGLYSNCFTLFFLALATPGLQPHAFTTDGTHPSAAVPGCPSNSQLAFAERDRGLHVGQEDGTATTYHPTWQSGKGLSLIACLFNAIIIMQHSSGVGYITLPFLQSLQ